MKKNEHKQPRAILLAVDPFDMSQDFAHQIGEGLLNLLGPDMPTIKPVYVLTPNATTAPGRWFDDVKPRLKEEATSRIEALFDANSAHMGRPEVLVEDQGSLRSKVERLNHFARQCRADLIVVPAVQEAPLRRLLLGSFSEAMLFHSALPILTVNTDHRQPPMPRRRCLAAIDTSLPSHASFAERVIELAKVHHFEVTFLQALRPGLRQATTAGSPTLIDTQTPVPTELADEQMRAFDLGNDLVNLATSADVQATSLMLISSLSVPKAVLHVAKVEGASLIAVASQSTPLRSLASRSIARDIIRQSEIPVWALSAVAMPSEIKSMARQLHFGSSTPASVF